MFRLLFIIALLIISCGPPSVSDYHHISSYKDSIDRNLSSLKRISKDVEGSTEGGEVALYLSGKDTLKIEATFYGETGKSNHVFYLKNRLPVFYTDTTYLYAAPIYISSDAKIDSMLVDQITLQGDSIVQWFRHEQPAKDADQKKGKEIIALYKRIQTLVKEEVEI
ncbi:hypothetical protein [Chitinophaga sp. HK235]|uniref:hypothetical protein n=1 Tax=Chitinophaga sp. HK235 TaxID=2952571 RepID=UPI001BAC80E7|nr:hypothetical protein [Chitinophaga sp. HK235]